MESVSHMESVLLGVGVSWESVSDTSGTGKLQAAEKGGVVARGFLSGLKLGVGVRESVSRESVSRESVSRESVSKGVGVRHLWHRQSCKLLKKEVS